MRKFLGGADEVRLLAGWIKGGAREELYRREVPPSSMTGASPVTA